jgi:integrase
MTISKELLDELLKGCERPEDLLGDAGLMKELKIKLMERMLGAELTAHLGYEEGKDAPPSQSNRRNGTAGKRLKGQDGEMPISVPRDRDGSFEPELVKKGQTRIDGMDDKIIGLYAAGLSVRDIRAHLEDVYGLQVSPDLISRVTDAVLDEVREWQSRALERMYPIVIFDALRVKIRDADSRMVKRYKSHAEQLHDFVLLMANTGLHPDEVKHLDFRDVTIVTDDYSGDQILEIEVRGKRGVGYCESMPSAVRPIDGSAIDPNAEDVATQPPKPTDRLFPNEFKKMFNVILEDNNLKFDRNGKARTAYSLRHSYICFRLLEGADIYQVAKNCRTSMEMIEKHYTAHLKDMIDTSLVNVRREKPKRRDQSKEDDSGKRPEA